MKNDDNDDNSRDYEIGYGRPPKLNQFKKGQSGNPKGRAKGQKNLKTYLAEELAQKISVTENGRHTRITKAHGMIKALAAKALRGDVRAITLLAGMTERYLFAAEGSSKTLPLAAEDELVLGLFARTKST